MAKHDGIWSKLLTSVRAGAQELGEAWADSQALRILDQEIRDCDIDLRQSRESLAHLIARHTLAERNVRYIEAWEWDPVAKTWWLISGLPDFWEGQ